MDAYEYPDDPRQVPLTSVTWEEAAALCAKQGKRLCLREELVAACQGPQGWKYPYGDEHRTSLCQDAGTSLARGHEHPGCRSWWGAYDLTGNAWEWSASKHDPNGVWAYGGYFAEGPQASCQEAKHSFFPQNRYSTVGFRCCEDAP
jgi:formylglycine-generating enzyme required for sulfatase activity